MSFTTKAALTNAVAQENMTVNSFEASIIPNPAAGEAYVYIQTQSRKDASVFLTDAAGKVLWSAEHTLSRKIKLPANSISNGAYFVMIISGDEKKTLRFVRQQ
ncbi:MAG TPA: T9SS type A sorting domain-containing protein [Parafilimonas sp.]|nr:T9SS type A sorting domain-containing protein [Parafilimonas sp.]